MNHRCHLVIAAWILTALAATTTIAGSIQYEYALLDYSADQDGWTLTGSITTNALGILTASNIVDWSWTVTKPGNPNSPYSLNLTTNTQSFLYGTPLTATPTQLLFDSQIPGGVMWLGNYNDTLQWASMVDDGIDILPPYYLADGSIRFWTTNAPAMNGSSVWVIAQIVPEPATLALLTIATPVLLRGKR